MKILIDIGHPAHVHFFSRPIKIWQEKGCEIVVTSRHKEMATDLLDALEVKHTPLSIMNNGGIVGMTRELFQRDLKLLQVVRKEKPDILIGIGGIFAAHVGFVTRTPSLVFYDTENATLSNLITYPFCSQVVVPECYNAWLPKWNLKYPGYHELSYLHPNILKANKKIAIENGLQPDKKNFLIRVVSWQASHDLNEKNWSLGLLRDITKYLAQEGNVIISAEGELPADLKQFGYTGAPEKIHHLLAYLSMFIGESATMASECAVLGVPGIYAAQTGRGYTDEQEKKYGLVFNMTKFDSTRLKNTIAEILKEPHANWHNKQKRMLEEKIDVAHFVADLVMNYPGSLEKYRSQFAVGA